MAIPSLILKRNGTTVPFNQQKITSAIKNACIATNLIITEEDMLDLTESVLLQIDKMDQSRLTVEQTQDTVEQVLMEAGHFKTAKAYILYRYEHTKERRDKIEQKIEADALYVTKRNGKKEPFSIDKVASILARAVEGYESVINTNDLLGQCKGGVYDGITTREVSRVLIMAARSYIERDPAYSKVAARLLLFEIYKEVFAGIKLDYDELPKIHEEMYRKNYERAVALGRLDKKILSYDLEKYARNFDLSRDDSFDYLGLETLCNRYLLRDQHTGQLLETPQMFWMRVAIGTAWNESKAIKEKIIADFYWVLSDFYYTPGGRTLFHAATPKPQLSSCYLNVVSDSLDDIFQKYADNAQLLKWSGGTGTSWTPVRATGAIIQGIGVPSQGIVPFMKISSDVNVSINRSGKRRGAGCLYLETWHYDIIDFLELRKNTGDERRRTHDINTANWIPDLFMKRVRENAEWTLFSPEETPELHDLYGKAFEEKYTDYERRADNGEITLYTRMPALDLWKKMLAMLFETGHPWITFKDPSNIRSPQDHDGVIHSSNLCTEITLNTSMHETAVCNLGSLNFARFIRDGVFDKELVSRVVIIAMRMLDNVIDINYYPTEDTRTTNTKHRPVGLGIRGFQDALYQLDITFDSSLSVQFADESMEVVAHAAILASTELARERGAYKTYKGSKWDRGILPQDTLDLLSRERGINIPIPNTAKLDWEPVRKAIKKYGMRNSNCMAMAPTASTANLVGCIPTIEPIYKNLYVKSNQAGEFVVINKYLIEDLKKENLWNADMLTKLKYHDGSIQDITEIPQELKDKYKETFEIEPKWLILAAAYRGKWIDQSQSLNMFYRGESGKELSDMYFFVWEMGLKTTYYLRTLGASQVEKSTVSTAEYGSTHTRKKMASVPVATGPAVTEVKSNIASPIVSTVAARVPQKISKIHVAEDAMCEGCEG